jgi:hypothetical protein
MNLIQIDDTDIILQDFEAGHGKIIISDNDWGYNFSHYWGAMGENTNIAQFLCRINSSYFIDKLSNRQHGDFSPKKTFKNIRKYIREECSCELPWYKHLEFQKDLREKLNDWEKECGCEHEFVNSWTYFFKYTLNYYLIEDRYDQKEIESMFNNITEEWNFIVYDEPRENIWLNKLFPKLQSYLKKEPLMFLNKK